jgi:hypothetical protein
MMNSFYFYEAGKNGLSMLNCVFLHEYSVLMIVG